MPEVPEEIPAVHFDEAQRLIAEGTGESLEDHYDLAPAHERWLGEWARDEHGSEFLFVTGYPMRVRPFYTHPDPTRPESSNGLDLLFRGLATRRLRDRPRAVDRAADGRGEHPRGHAVSP